MRQQLTLAAVNFDKHNKQTRRAKFLAEMDQVVPWRELCAIIEPYYPMAGNGRPPIGLGPSLDRLGTWAPGHTIMRACGRCTRPWAVSTAFYV